MAQRDARRTASRRHAGIAALWAALALTLALVACRGTPTPPPTAIPSPTPTTTPDPRRAMDEAVFTIFVDDRLLGVETFRLGEEAGALIAFSELVRLDGVRTTERRTVVLSDLLNPLRYDLEIGALGARSIWVGERNGESMDVLNNNLAWFGPVLVEGVTPAPEVLLESAPSALPYALLALRDFGPEGMLRVHALDVLEDLPVTRGLTVTVDTDRQGAVIGTVAVEGHREGDDEAAFTMWVRPGSRALYSVEVPEHRFGLWAPEGWSDLAGGTVVIQRVSSPPELPAPVPPGGEAERTPIAFTSSDGTELAGTLVAPPGTGPFPCVVLLGPGGIAPRWDPGDALLARGWAALAYDTRGLGESGGEFVRDRPDQQAADARAAVATLRERPEIDAQRIVVLGVDAGGLVGALAVSDGDRGAAPAVGAAVLASLPGPGPVLPDLALHRIREVMAPFYGWGADETARYGALSVTNWQGWLFEGMDEVTLLRRRVPLRPLRALADLDLARVLAGTEVPLLLVQGGDDPWVPEGAANALAERLAASGATVEAQVFAGLGHDLGRGSDAGALLAPEVDDAVWGWLEVVLEE